MPFVKTVILVGGVIQKAPSMKGSDTLHQDRIQREINDRINALNIAVKEIQDYLATLP